MKKTVTILSMLAVATAYGASKEAMTLEKAYIMAGNNIAATSTDFTLSFNIDRLGDNSTRNIVNLGSNYNMIAQRHLYIGMRANNVEQDNRDIANTPAVGEEPATNTYTVKSDRAEGTPADKVVGWVTLNATGTANPGSDFSKASVSISSSSTEGASQIEILDKVSNTPVKNIVKNTSTITLGNVIFTDTNMDGSGITVNGKTIADTTVITGQGLTNVPIAGPVYAGGFAFNFTVNSQADLAENAVIAAYFGSYTGDYDANAFLLTQVDNGWRLKVADGRIDSHTDPSAFTARTESDRFVTLSVDLEIGKEYTVVVNGTDRSQLVGLYDGKELLAYGSYNGNMNGNQSSGMFTTYMNETFEKAAPTPEPTTGTLSLLALAGLCARRRRK